MTTGVGGSSAEAELMRISPKREGIVPISDAERLGRIDKAQRLMREQGIQALYPGCINQPVLFHRHSVAPERAVAWRGDPSEW